VAKDSRLFAKFALDFPDSRKVLPLSDSAFRCLVEAIIWSRKEESDGWLARRLAVAKWSLDDLHELSTNDDDNPSLLEHEDGWQIHGFTDMQDTKAEIDARRERNRIAGQKGGLAKGKRGAKQGAKRGASQTPSENVAETETDSLTPNGVREVAPSRSKPRKRIASDYMPLRGVIDKLRSEYPTLADSQLKALHEDFVLYWQGQGRPMADWDATWLRWMRKEAAKLSGVRTGTDGMATADRRVAETQALKLVPTAGLEIEP
jgi:hypothetical protein